MSSTSAVQIVKIDDKENNTFSLNTTPIENVLNRADVKDRSLVIISIAGPVRKGKSFMLNFFLRYMNSKYKNLKSDDSWIGDENENLTGFTWSGGNKKITSGLMVWPDVFLYDYTDGKKVAILLMDTQGTFDNNSTFRTSVTIFALSQLLASVQIYNLSRVIQENNLQYLNFFAEYGKLAQGATTGKPFQKLQFLIRDWSYPYETPYGAVGGKTVINKVLLEESEQTYENNEVRQNIRSSFETIDCFLMPHPGQKVATDQNFRGQLKDIDEDFITHLKEFVPSIFAPENLIIKKINGVEVKAKEFINYLISYKNSLSGSTLPTPKTNLAATADAQNVLDVSRAKDYYSQLMETTFNPNVYSKTDVLQAMHIENNKKAFDYYNLLNLQSIDTTRYKEELKEGNEKMFCYYVLKNQKNMPNICGEVKKLLETITSQEDIIDIITAQNTESIIIKFNSDRQTCRQVIEQLKQSFAENLDKEFSFMKKLLNSLRNIPFLLFCEKNEFNQKEDHHQYSVG